MLINKLLTEYNNIFQDKRTCLSMNHLELNRGPGSSVGITTGYGLDGPGIEFRWGEILSNVVGTATGYGLDGLGIEFREARF